jgi:hypothetical protein
VYRFDAAFPFASDKEQDAEKAHLEKHFKVLTDNTVRGVWITSTDASTLAKEYHLEPYVEALKESSPGKPTDTLTPMKSPADIASTKAGSVQSTPSVAPEAPVPRRSRRSVSPKKAAAPKSRAASKAGSTGGRGRKKKGSVVDDESVASTSSPAVPHVVPEEIIGKAEKAIEKAAAKEEKPILDTIKVGVLNPCLSVFNLRLRFIGADGGRRMIQRNYWLRQRLKLKLQRQKKNKLPRRQE